MDKRAKNYFGPSQGFLFRTAKDVMGNTLPPTHHEQCCSLGNRKDKVMIQNCFGSRGGKKICSFGHLKCVSWNETGTLQWSQLICP